MMLMHIASNALFLFAISSFVTTQRLSFSSFSPALSSKSYNVLSTKSTAGLLPPSSDGKTAAISYARRQYNLTEKDYKLTNVYTTKHNKVTHVYLRQLFKGVEVSNAVMNINVDSNGNVISSGSSFIQPSLDMRRNLTLTSRSLSTAMSATEALTILFNYLKLALPQDLKEKKHSSLKAGKNTLIELVGVPFAQENIKAEQRYLLTENGELIPTWRLNMRMENNWVVAHVPFQGSQVLQINDWVSDAAYHVIQLGDSDPSTNNRTMVKDPEFIKASPKGWTKDNTEFNNTRGNNVWAQENWKGGEDFTSNARPEASAEKVFDAEYNSTSNDYKSNANAAIINLFYWNNVLHDIFYMYGFDEEAGNFQNQNWDKGGEGGDFVIANAQDGSGMNNANFASPPDGQNGRMRMYVFDTVQPYRDGDFESDIISHEYGHGVSTRLTGGPQNSDCLADGQAAGMGEGWSDFFAIVLEMKEVDTREKDVQIGKWVNGGKGIRNFPYSTDLKVNPITFKFLNDATWKEVHATGEVWCAMLYEMLWNLIDATKKYNSDLYSADIEAGNTLALQIVIDGLKLQPCNPDFLTSRDAILLAEKIITGGKYQCHIWKAFAKRGLGDQATIESGVVKEDFSVPMSCQ